MTDVKVSEDDLAVHLEDGRSLTVLLAFYPTLLSASPEQRQHWQIIGDGDVIDWPDLDIQLSARGLFEGVPERKRQWQVEAEALAGKREKERKASSSKSGWAARKVDL